MAFSDAVEARLWFLLRQSLHSKNAWSKLKALNDSEGKTIDKTDLDCMLDTRISQAGDKSVEPSYRGQDVEVLMASLDQMTQPEHAGGVAQDMLEDEPDVHEAYFHSLEDERSSVFLDHAKWEDNLFSDIEDGACDFVSENQVEEDLSWSQVDPIEDLLDGACDFVHQEADNEDLFWSDLEDKDRLDEFYSPTWALYDLQDKSMSEDELLDNAESEIGPLDDQFLDLEDTWPHDADVSDGSTSQNDLVQGSEMLLAI